MKRILVAAALAAIITGQTAIAEGFQIVQSRDAFVRLIDGRQLTRMGIRLVVTTDGQIVGRAFGTDVTGAWDWAGGYFCRDLFYGEEDLGPNCQQVAVSGETMRFTSDRGAGRFADLRLR
ncbi:MAG: dihydrodipicolinate reductase [Pseudomonadota bacterium]